MATLENISLVAAIIVVALSIVFSFTAMLSGKKTKSPSGETGMWQTDRLGIVTAGLAFLLLTVSIVARVIQTGHGPFSNMYEFSVAFSWGIVAMGLYFQWRFKAPAVKIVGLVVAFGLLIFASTLSSKPAPLVPALQQSTLLSVHVACAIIAYGAFTIGFGSAILFLVQNRKGVSWLPSAETLDSMSYHSVVIGFPFLTLTILLGALWADIAWGRYWGWDPKETASLVTWLLFAAYLHARIMRGWRGTRAATLIILGFVAVLFTFFGNYIFSGLHSYN
ncbi:MAG: c-type cytochrome biogenesis protein CcsB [Chloroflexota bacterium]